MYERIRSNSGNKVIECGSTAIMVFVLILALFQIPNFPVWVLASLFMLVFLLCLLTIQTGHVGTSTHLSGSPKDHGNLDLDLAPSNEFHYACRAASGVSPSTPPVSLGGTARWKQ